MCSAERGWLAISANRRKNGSASLPPVTRKTPMVCSSAAHCKITRRIQDLDAVILQSGCAFEVQLLAGFLTLFFYRRSERAARFEELDQALNFDVIFFFCAASEARGKAHLHFGVEAAGKRGIAADFNLAAANFE